MNPTSAPARNRPVPRLRAASLLLVALVGLGFAAPARTEGPAPTPTAWQDAKKLTLDELAKTLRTTGVEKPAVFHVGFRVLFVQAHIPGSQYAGPGSSPAGLDANENVIAWQNHIVGQSILAGTPFDNGKGGIDRTSVEGSDNLPYAFPNMKVELTTTKVGVPVLWWRSVGSTHTAYAVEAFIDEVAEAAGKDSIAFRLALIKNRPRHVAALKLAAEKAGWGQSLPAGRFRGVAVAESFGTVVAEIAEISVQNGEPKVHRVVCAVDCGIAVNPDNVRAQMEGGIGFGLGAVLKSKLTLDKGRVVEGNFDSYEVLRLDEMPAVEVHIVPSEAKPSGVGEPGVPPIGPAVANAFYQATKRRIRALPFKQSQNT